MGHFFRIFFHWWIFYLTQKSLLFTDFPLFCQFSAFVADFPLYSLILTVGQPGLMWQKLPFWAWFLGEMNVYCKKKSISGRKVRVLTVILLRAFYSSLMAKVAWGWVKFAREHNFGYFRPNKHCFGKSYVFFWWWSPPKRHCGNPAKLMWTCIFVLSPPPWKDVRKLFLLLHHPFDAESERKKAGRVS